MQEPDLHLRPAVSIAGIGIMGRAMVRNLVAAGHEVAGFDPSSTAMESLVELGGLPSIDIAHLATQSEFLITCLPSVAALDEVVDRLCADRGRVRILAETSTFPLKDKLRVRQLLGTAGIEMLDAPLSGSGNQAWNRDVVVYASGESSAFAAFKPIFDGFSRAPHHLGEFGNGTRMKFVANLLVAIHTAAAGEAFALARKAGLDPAQVLAMVSDGAGYSRSLAARGEMLVADRYEPVQTMPLNLWKKDLKVIGEFAADLGCPTPLFSTSTSLFTSALACGLGAQDTAAVALISESLAGLTTSKGV
jgi:3-hydroxyisobutyrate dehydrogenase-like beta-hydroxyacid dehydrogenase